MRVDVFRIIIFAGGILAGASIFVGYGQWFITPDGFNGVILTIFSILAGFQMTLFSSLSSFGRLNLNNKILSQRARRSINKKFYRQYGIFILYFIVIIITVVESILIQQNAIDFLKRVSISLTIVALFWSLEIPKLILQLRNEE
jgi:hypothetical protein